MVNSVVGRIKSQPPGLFCLNTCKPSVCTVGKEWTASSKLNSRIRNERRKENERQDSKVKRVWSEERRERRGKRGEDIAIPSPMVFSGGRGEMKECSVLRAETILSWGRPGAPCRAQGFSLAGATETGQRKGPDVNAALHAAERNGTAADARKNRFVFFLTFAS